MKSWLNFDEDSRRTSQLCCQLKHWLMILLSQTWRHRTIISTLKRLWQENSKVKTSLNSSEFKAILSNNNKTKQKEKRKRKWVSYEDGWFQWWKLEACCRRLGSTDSERREIMEKGKNWGRSVQWSLVWPCVDSAHSKLIPDLSCGSKERFTLTWQLLPKPRNARFRDGTMGSKREEWRKKSKRRDENVYPGLG